MTTKTIYFGMYSPADLDEMGIEGFKHNGNEYEYRMDIYLEDGFMRITDSINRMIPIDMTHYADLAVALDMASSLQELTNHRNKLDEVLANGRTTVGLEFDSEMDEFIVN